MNEHIDFKWIKEHYFSESEKTIDIKKGEILLDYNQRNTRLYLVLEGEFYGYLKDAKLENYPIFEADKNKFIGVYSYFSKHNLSYSRVIANEDSKVAYYDKALADHDDIESGKIMPFLLSVIVNELYSRQHFTKKMAIEKQEDVQKLLKAEKMATLGQMAAGLAHELNNSIGVINSHLEQIQAFISATVKEKNGDELFKYFKTGLDVGQELSSADAREKRSIYEATLRHLSSNQIKKLSRTGFDPQTLLSYIKDNSERADEVINNWELGCTLHDMHIAARHSSHVVRSVKQLGVAEHQWSKNVDINETISEALVIVQNLTKRVHMNVQLSELPPTEACAGELSQVWINLIKNGIESMIQTAMESPELTIKTQLIDEMIAVSIIDNGPGIPKKIMTHIFEPSFTTKVGGLSFGLGLGLAIVQRIVTGHEGLIEVSSQPGQTIFTIKIPLT
ncbi:MAG: signal transduction histidine kinase [Cyclobacteriaceae bacterium]|jgi:signal transduction histidine kinase